MYISTNYFEIKGTKKVILQLCKLIQHTLQSINYQIISLMKIKKKKFKK